MGKLIEEIWLEDFCRKVRISGGPGILWGNRTMSEITEKGCDLQKECGFGFYCTVIRGKSNAWATMVAKYCHGSDYLLCARRIYFLKKGWCAPLDMTPIGILPAEILAEL